MKYICILIYRNNRQVSFTLWYVLILHLMLRQVPEFLRPDFMVLNILSQH